MKGASALSVGFADERVRNRRRSGKWVGVKLKEEIGFVDHQKLQLVVLKWGVVNSISSVHGGVVAECIRETKPRCEIAIGLLEECRGG